MRGTFSALRSGALGAALLITALAGAPAHAEEPSRTTATYDDWMVICERPENQAVKVCEVSQTLQIGEPQQNVAAQIVFGKLQKSDPLRLILQLPVGIWLPEGVELSMGEGTRPIPVQIKFCISACVGELDLTPQQVADISKASGTGTLTFQDRNQTRVAVPISLKGLSTALAIRERT